MLSAVYVIPSISTGPMTDSSSRSITASTTSTPSTGPNDSNWALIASNIGPIVLKLGDTAVCSQLSPIRNCRYVLSYSAGMSVGSIGPAHRLAMDSNSPNSRSPSSNVTIPPDNGMPAPPRISALLAASTR